ncbi:MAG TPA: hypothetical protein VGH33_27110 [Isosphaeraceae bacterium]|jgi:hypothetical protein
MPSYLKVDGAWMTIAPGQTIGAWASWENIPGVGPNQGPLFIMADPKPHQTDPKTGQGGEIKLTTFDLTKCRRGGGAGSGSTEVFYEYKIRSESQITATFDLEMIDFKDLMH